MCRFAIVWMLGSCAACAFAAEPAPADDAAQCGVSATQYSRATVDYLCDALLLVERYSLSVGTVDWPAIKAKAVAEAEAAQAIVRSMLRSLGDRHSTLLPASRVAQLRALTALEWLREAGWRRPPS